MESLLQHLSQALSETPFLAYLGVFVGGVISSSSPCVLATIPLVIGYVGGYAEGLFGVVSRTWYFVVAGIAIGIGLHLMGLFEWSLPIPVRLQPKRRGVLGALLLGFFFGLISSPLATPVLALILTSVATKGEVVYGTSLLFIYAIGHCVLIFLAGTATGFVEGFIRSRGLGQVTVWGKRVGGMIVVLVGGYLVYLGITL